MFMWKFCEVNTFFSLKYVYMYVCVYVFRQAGRHRFVVPVIYFVGLFCICPDWGQNLQTWHIGTTV